MYLEDTVIGESASWSETTSWRKKKTPGKKINKIKKLLKKMLCINIQFIFITKHFIGGYTSKVQQVIVKYVSEQEYFKCLCGNFKDSRKNNLI